VGIKELVIFLKGICLSRPLGWQYLTYLNISANCIMECRKRGSWDDPPIFEKLSF